MKRALVTGAAGFIGRHFSKALRDRGYLVAGIDVERVPDGYAMADYVQGDVRTVLAGAVPWLADFDLVVHAAAVVGGRAMIDGAPLTLATTDLAIDADLFRWAMRTRPRRILYFSSSAAYPVAWQGRDAVACGRRLDESLIDLDRPLPPDQSYGHVKLMGERLAAMARADGLAVTVVRPFTGYGSDQADSYPFPAIIDRALHADNPLEVWADTVRDFVHVDDVVEACFAIMRAQECAIDGDERPVNIGTGRPVSMRELARKVANAIGYDCDVRADTSKPAGVLYRVADCSRLHEFYTPTITLEAGIARALADRS